MEAYLVVNKNQRMADFVMDVQILCVLVALIIRLDKLLKVKKYSNNVSCAKANAIVTNASKRNIKVINLICKKHCLNTQIQT